ncbi:hypothetical protein LEP1GSC059_3325 [Leptospira noguchii serovar Panama str. CZ214]|uniref:Uncharacterized protein n=1 Tax=Leptospira noguchii serovar Panama str. CZ214 TaxID=1001595 RepID=T0GVB3_9LEPT|nr:hypothetical protein LEP1GSC059_3325 [Leptospira noguchii serovar Panama str. CZ214]
MEEYFYFFGLLAFTFILSIIFESPFYFFILPKSLSLLKKIQEFLIIHLISYIFLILFFIGFFGLANL